MNELLIRGATVIDGLGHDPVRADIAIAGGRIAAIGDIAKDAAKVVDAGGLTLMPGIIDIHTYYDAQLLDPTLSPSPSLGVTTVVTKGLRLQHDDITTLQQRSVGVGNAGLRVRAREI